MTIVHIQEPVTITGRVTAGSPVAFRPVAEHPGDWYLERPADETVGTRGREPPVERPRLGRRDETSHGPIARDRSKMGPTVSGNQLLAVVVVDRDRVDRAGPGGELRV